MNSSPYRNLPASAFWKSGVVEAGDPVPLGLYSKKWHVSRMDRIATAGSCFAQHIGRTLKANGYDVIDVEPAPFGLPATMHSQFGHGIYSARFGNIYTARQLLQLVQDALSGAVPKEAVWQNSEGLWIDALRPSVEPKGFELIEEVRAHRRQHLMRVREMFLAADLIIFTLGLTEAWVHRSSGIVFPTAPGTIAGIFDPDTYRFHNFRLAEIVADLKEIRSLIHGIQEKPCRILLTVSPVPLTATATKNHVMVATMSSKATLRAAAAELSEDFEDIDYFPSYEIIMNPWTDACAYELNLRSVRKEAVALVMKAFLSAHEGAAMTAEFQALVPHSPRSTQPPSAIGYDVVCEDVLLEAFAGKSAL